MTLDQVFGSGLSTVEGTIPGDKSQLAANQL